MLFAKRLAHKASGILEILLELQQVTSPTSSFNVDQTSVLLQSSASRDTRARGPRPRMNDEVALRFIRAEKRTPRKKTHAARVEKRKGKVGERSRSAERLASYASSRSVGAPPARPALSGLSRIARPAELLTTCSFRAAVQPATQRELRREELPASSAASPLNLSERLQAGPHTKKVRYGSIAEEPPVLATGRS